MNEFAALRNQPRYEEVRDDRGVLISRRLVQDYPQELLTRFSPTELNNPYNAEAQDARAAAGLSHYRTKTDARGNLISRKLMDSEYVRGLRKAMALNADATSNDHLGRLFQAEINQELGRPATYRLD